MRYDGSEPVAAWSARLPNLPIPGAECTLSAIRQPDQTMRLRNVPMRSIDVSITSPGWRNSGGVRCEANAGRCTGRDDVAWLQRQNA